MKGISIAGGIIVLLLLYYFMLPSSHEIRNSTPTGKNIICFGDSLTYGTGAGKGLDYPAQLAKLINQPVINAGVPGDTTTTALKRLDSVLKQDPRIVLLTLGGNDLKNGVKKETAFQNLELIVTRLQDHGSLVIIGGLDIPLRGRGFAKAYVELSEKTGSVLIPDILEDIFGNQRLMSDTIHPNSAGYEKMAQYFYKAIQPYL